MAPELCILPCHSHSLSWSLCILLCHTHSLSCWRPDRKHLLFPSCLKAPKGKLIFSSAGNQFQSLAKCSTIELEILVCAIWIGVCAHTHTHVCFNWNVWHLKGRESRGGVYGHWFIRMNFWRNGQVCDCRRLVCATVSYSCEEEFKSCPPLCSTSKSDPCV